MSGKMKGLTAIISAISLLALSGCGGGGGATTIPAGAATAAGIFLDAPVQGVSYTSGNTTGTTGADGSFTYEVGQAVVFKLGGIVLGTVTPTSTTTAVITPVEMVTGATNTTNATVQQLALFLQTIDSDNNPNNGIQISAAAVLAATAQTVDFANPASVNAVLAVVAPGVAIVTPAQAKAHMDSARQATAAGYFTGTFTGTCGTQPDFGTWSATIDSVGNLTGTGIDTAFGGSSTMTGSSTAMGAYSGTDSGAAGSANWTGSVSLDGSISGTWVGTGGSTGCSGTYIGAKSVNNVATFAGSYQGTFAGADSGTWTATVAANGTATGSGMSALVGAFTLTGTVGSNGSATMAQSVGGASTGAAFSATFNAYGGVTGNWVNGGTTGTLAGFRN